MGKKSESIFLNEYFMAAMCGFIVVTSIVSFVLIRFAGEGFAKFEVVVKLLTAVAMYFAYKKYNWDVAKGLMGGVLFCIMYQEAYLVLANLWAEEDFDTYLVVGVQGSIYLAAAGMSFMMTIIITINHFFINYASHGNPENVLLNRLAMVFKFVVYVILLLANSQLTFSSVMLWRNALQYLTDMALLMLIVSIESQLDLLKVLRKELLAQKKKKEKEGASR